MGVRELTYGQALNEALRDEMRRDDSVFIMGEDVGPHGGVRGISAGLYEEFGERRVCDTPISEAGFVGVAIGAALMGLRPVAEIMYIDFAALVMDQMVNQAAKVRYMFGGKARVPLVMRTQGGGGMHYGAQHSQSLESWFVHIPGLVVVQPATPHDAKGLLTSEIRSDDPVVFIENKTLYETIGPVPEGEFTIPIGVADIKRSGSDVTIVATSKMVHVALDAAQQLAEEGIEAEVVDPRTLRPLDIDSIIGSVRKTKRLVVVSEGCRIGGFTSEVAACVMDEAFECLDAPIQRVAAKDVPIPYNERLENAVLPNTSDVVEAVRTVGLPARVV